MMGGLTTSFDPAGDFTFRMRLGLDEWLLVNALTLASRLAFHFEDFYKH